MKDWFHDEEEETRQLLKRIDLQNRLIIRLLARQGWSLKRMEIEMAQNWDAFAAEVERDREVDSALASYLDRVVADLEALKTGMDATTQAKIDEFTTKLKAQNDEMVTKIPANTPADPNAPLPPAEPPPA